MSADGRVRARGGGGRAAGGFSLALILLAACLPDCQPAPSERPRPSEPSESLSAVGEHARLRFALHLEPPAPETGRMFRVITEVRDARTEAPLEVSQYRLNATMPEHAHGMATRPMHRDLGAGRYVSDGMKLHMPGLWHFTVEATALRFDGQAVRDRAVFAFEQPVLSAADVKTEAR